MSNAIQMMKGWYGWSDENVDWNTSMADGWEYINANSSVWVIILMDLILVGPLRSKNLIKKMISIHEIKLGREQKDKFN